MRRVLAIILWTGVPFCWQPLWGQAPSVGVDPGQNKKQQSNLGTPNANNEQRGTPMAPLIVETHNRPDSPEEATKHKAENDAKEYRDRWAFRLTVIVAICTG